MRAALKEALFIVIISAVLGLAANTLNPRGVSVAARRPTAAPAADSLLAADAVDGPPVVDRRQVLNLLEGGKALLIDARTPEEFAVGHIPGAVNIAVDRLEEFVEQMEALPQDKLLICYCDGPPCDKGETLARLLFEQGFKRCAYYDAGLDDWKANGGEVVR